MNFSNEEARMVLDAIDFYSRGINKSLEESSPDLEKRTHAEKKLQILHRVEAKLADPTDSASPVANTAAGELTMKFNKHHVLLVDDSEAIRQHEAQLLTKHGFNQIDHATDGHEAIAMIKNKVIPYDLILCDLNMPTISGLDVLRLLRKEKDCGKIPFIMITSENNREVLIEAMKAGVSDFVAKPVEEENLLRKITALL